LKFYAEDWDGKVKPPRSKGFIADINTGEICSPALAGTTACTDNFGFNVGTNDLQDIRVDDNGLHTTEREGLSYEFNYDISDSLSLTSITGLNQLDRTHTFNCDASTARLCNGALGVDSKVFTQELRINQEFSDTSLSGKHYLIAGLFFIDEQIDQINDIDLFYDFRGFTAQGPAHFFYDNEVDIQSIAVFGQVDYQLTDHLILTTGLRFTSEETNYLATSQINVPTEPGDFDGLLVPGWEFTGNVTDDEFSGKLALVHQLNDNISMYYSLNRGFKSGGYNGALAFTADEARLADYGPETLTAWEIGTKATFDNLNLNAAVFYYDYQDQQVFMNSQSSQPLSAPAQILDNVGESEIYGMDLDATYVANYNWLFRFGVGYLPQAELAEFVDLQGNIVRDNRLPFSSRWNLNGLANYQTDVGNGTLRIQLEFDYQSDFYFDQNENPLAEQNAFTLFNGNISYDINDWQFVLWGKNLTDKEYSQILFDMGAAFGLVQDLRGEERRYGVDIRYRF
jgi:iron complex outermembrane receptor protein